MVAVRWLVVAIALASAGCESMPRWSMLDKIPTPGEVLHNLQPHRLAHLNRGPALGRGDSFYSVPDSVAEPADAEP